MPRQRPTLIDTARGFRARLTLPGGRRMIDLGTTDRATARRKLTALVATIKEGR